MSLPEAAIEVTIGELACFVGLDEIVITGPGPCPEARQLPPHPDVIREHVRFDAAGSYRPLSGLRNLPPDWHLRALKLEVFGACVDAVYPLAQTHAALYAEGRLAVTTLDDLFARQRGRYASASRLSSAGRALARRALCGACVRSPLWDGASHVPEGGIPCPEPCSVMLSLCREIALWEDSPPAHGEPDAQVPFAAFETPGNRVREACLRAMETTHA